MYIANVLQPLIDACQWILEFWHDLIGDFPGSWGWSIILLTFTVRIAILPLTFKGVKSMQRLQTLQPKIKEIQARFKDDKQRMNQEVMAFYQREKVNPLGSCLPLLLQIPFFISLFSLLRSTAFRQDIASNPGFWPIPNLAEKVTDPVLLGVLIVLYVGTQLAASAVTAISADPTQRRIMFALPFVFVVFIINFPAGLIVYWITTNVWTIGQQLSVKKMYPKPDPLDPTGRRDRRQTGTRQTAWPPRLRRTAAAEVRRRRARRRPRRRRWRRARPRRRRSRRARRRSARGAGVELPDESVAEGRGETLGEAKWAAMKELERASRPDPGLRAVRRHAGRRLGRPAHVPAEVDEEAWRAAAGTIPAEAAERVRAIVGARRERPGVARDGRHRRDRRRDPRHRERGRPGSPDRQARLDDRRAPAPGVPRRPSAGEEIRKQVTVDAAGYRERARGRAAPDGGPGLGRGAPLRAAGRARADARDRAKDRAHVPERAQRRGDAQRGRRAGPPAGGKSR